MPAIANRESHERRITAALKKCRGKQRDELLRLLGNPPDYRNVPDEFWDRAEECEREALLLFLPLLYAAGGERLAKQIGFELNKDVFMRRSERFGEQQARRFARESIRNSKAWLKEKINAARKVVGRDLENGDLDLDPIFGDGRAEAAGNSETTAANSYGEDDVIDRARDAGLTLKVFWTHNPHRPPRHSKSHVEPCPVCTPFDGKEETIWRPLFPKGPPAHPWCDCFTVVAKKTDTGWEVDGEPFDPNVGIVRRR